MTHVDSKYYSKTLLKIGYDVIAFDSLFNCNSLFFRHCKFDPPFEIEDLDCPILLVGVNEVFVPEEHHR
jgi:hypothetical protein